MSFLLGFLGAVIGIIVIIFLIIIIIVKKLGLYNTKTLMYMAKDYKNIAEEELTRPKSVSGMTKIIEPEIIRDFPEFNKNMLFNMLENNLIKIFSSIENKHIQEDDKDLNLVVPILKEKVNDLINNNIKVKYDNIVFHEHAIKSYERLNGMATITTSTSLEYFYNNSSKQNQNNNIKKQTRYTCKFVYIYDETKLERNNKIFIVRCPNCGAPLKKVDSGECEYCSSHFKPINLKLWKMSSYKEDYN